MWSVRLCNVGHDSVSHEQLVIIDHFRDEYFPSVSCTDAAAEPVSKEKHNNLNQR